MESEITGIRGPDKRRLFTQRLFNRLMFIAFIQRKGWLKFPAMEDCEYLEALWKEYQTTGKRKSGFYGDRLYHLFFYGLNSPVDVNLASKLAQRAKLTPVIGDVPYLNGGLFEKSEDGTDDNDAGIAIPDQAINAVLHELFARFNFTVTESTPLDVEVAVDPEMLGKVFEELVTGRHETGSYYTPKPIVSFMCREALKGYLESKCPAEKPHAIARFVDEHDAADLSDGEAVLAALKIVRCCDPACGSGAYLLGMMHELLDLRQTLFRTNRQLDAVNVYQRKLDIIQTNVYGVDLDQFAINIARLRLWLSLAVDFNGETPPPLPNLDFKIESGDSLAAPDPSGGFNPGFQAAMVDEFLDLKRQYLMSHGTGKKELKRKIEKLREKIMSWTGFVPEPGMFHWQVEFAEVFVKTEKSPGGFDCILANPPYVRQELIKEQKPRLKEVFGPLFSGTADLYVFFYLRGLQLLTPGGMLAYISSNKWFRAGYGEKLRAHIAKTTTVQTILDFHDLPVFEAIAYPMIFTAAKRPPGNTHTVTLAEPPDLQPPYPDVKEVVAKYGHRMPTTAMGRDGAWHLATSGKADRLAKMRSSGPTLNQFVGGQIFNGVKTGLNAAFVLTGEQRDELVREDADAAQFIVPYMEGDDIKRWRAQSGKKWLIYLTWTDKLESRSIAKWLKRFTEQLRKRDGVKDGGPCPWFALSRPRPEASTFIGREKIVFPDIAPRPQFALDVDHTMLANTGYIIPSNDLYLLGVLNSKTVETYYIDASAQVRGGYLRFIRQYVEKIPIPTAPAADRSAIASLTQKCLDAKGVGCEACEKEIDARVAALYRL